MITSKLFKLDPSRVSLYYDVFKYKMSIDIINIHFFRRVKTHQQFVENIDILHEERWTRDIKFDNLEVIQQFVEWRKDVPTDGSVKISVQQDRIVVYTNTLPLFQTLLDKLDEYSDETSRLHIQYFQAKQIGNYEKGVIYHKDPKHKFRVYLSCQRRTPEQTLAFNESLQRYGVTPSKSLQNWLIAPPRTSFMWGSHGLSWSWSHYSFDFDDESLITLFLLSHEDWIGKICRIEKR